MRKEPYIRTLLGVTQLEMAMLLHINRTQWSMYELGLRPLPSHAMQLMGEMIIHAENHKKKARGLPTPSAQHLKQQYKKLEYLLREIEFQQLTLSRKIAAVTKKQAAQLKLLQRADFLNGYAKNENAAARYPLHQGHADWAIYRALETDHSGTLMMYEHRLKVLDFEKTLLEPKLREIEASLNEGNVSITKES